ncbi:MAG: hypothetical protein RIB98_01880 [Acidimicrobiales bacterium]
MRRPWIVLVLIVCAVVGGVLIITADESEAPVDLEAFTTEEGLVTEIPSGWVVSEEFPFDFAPPDEGKSFNQWTVARACPSEGCAERSLDEWLGIASELPMFTAIEDADEDGLIGVEGETGADVRIVRAQTESAGRLVLVAAFTDGAEDFVACGARLGIAADERLLDAIVDVCRSTERADSSAE